MIELVVGKSYPFTEKPTVKGDYNYWGAWASAAPCYASFDGENWICGGGGAGNFWIHTDKPAPFGHYDPAVLRVPPPPNDLASRLARFKAAKEEA